MLDTTYCDGLNTAKLRSALTSNFTLRLRSSSTHPLVYALLAAVFRSNENQCEGNDLICFTVGFSELSALNYIGSDSSSYKHVSDSPILNIDVSLHQDTNTIFSSGQQQMLKGLQKTLRQTYNPVFSTRPRLRSPCLTLINHTVRMSSSEEPTAEGAKVLFEKLEQKFPSKTLGRERWYLVAVRLSSDPSKLHSLISIR